MTTAISAPATAVLTNAPAVSHGPSQAPEAGHELHVTRPHTADRIQRQQREQAHEGALRAS